MFDHQLAQAVESFSSVMLPLSEDALGNTWAWKDHDEDGIRFAFFVALQELRQLAVTLSAFRPKPTPAQHILSQHHASYLDLQAAIFGTSKEDAEKAPAKGEWSLKKTYAHILGGDIGFAAVIRYALEGHHAGNWTPDKMMNEDADRVVNMTDEEYEELINDSLENMLAFHKKFHSEIIDEFSQITDSELELPSTYWEETRFPIRHRLHRFEAHIVQHTVQIDKTLVAIGQAPSESKRLIRKVFGALAEAEGMMIGTEKMDDTAVLSTASSIEERTKEIKGLIGGN
jgi:DinB superfamily